MQWKDTEFSCFKIRFNSVDVTLKSRNVLLFTFSRNRVENHGFVYEHKRVAKFALFRKYKQSHVKDYSNLNVFDSIFTWLHIWDVVPLHHRSWLCNEIILECIFKCTWIICKISQKLLRLTNNITIRKLDKNFVNILSKVFFSQEYQRYQFVFIPVILDPQKSRQIIIVILH